MMFRAQGEQDTCQNQSAKDESGELHPSRLWAAGQLFVPPQRLHDEGKTERAKGKAHDSAR